MEVQIPTVVTTNQNRDKKERRSNDRLIMTRPAKLYESLFDRYYSGQTSNISPSGALIVVSRSIPIASGDSIEVAIAQDSLDAIIPKNQMVTADVVRVTAVDMHTQAVAIQFLHNTNNAFPIHDRCSEPQAA